MFDFHFVYSDGNTYCVKDVTKIIVRTASGSKEISGDDILTATIPLNTTYLHTPDSSITVSGNNLMVIDAKKQTN